MPTNLMWVCICPGSTSRERDSGNVIGIKPGMACKECGQMYDKVNSACWTGYHS